LPQPVSTLQPLRLLAASQIYASGAHAHCCLCRYIKGSAVDPALPACAALAMPNSDLSQLEGTGTLRARTQQQSPGALVAGMASLAVLCAVAAAGVAGRVVLRRGRLRQAEAGQHSHSREMHSLLHRQRQRRTSSAAGSSERNVAEEGGSPLLPMNRGQDRLAALLHAELGSQQHRGIEMLPLEALPAALAHQLGSLRTAEKSSGAARSAASRAGAAARAADVAQWVPKEAQQLPPTQQAGEVEMDLLPGVNQAGGMPGIQGGYGSMPPPSRQWGLPTDSLQVSPGQLEVSAHRQHSLPTLTTATLFFW
jgi:hypothetical protein